MTKYLSRKLKFISLFLMIAVVFVHSYNYFDKFLLPSTFISEGFNPAAMFEYFISNGIARFAVPMFFAISGYLFYYTFRPSLKCYGYKLKSRFFSLVIPFVIWNCLSGLFLFILSNIESVNWVPIISEKVGITAETGVLGVLKWFIDPPAFQSWYLQQLIIFTVISPIIFWAIKYTRGFVIILFAIPWILDISYIINSEAILFYVCGATIAIFNREDWVLQKESKPMTALITFCWLCINALKTVFAAINPEQLGSEAKTVLTISMIALSKISVILGIFVMWYMFDHIVKRIESKRGMLLLTGHLFFIYIMHEPLLHICFELGLGLGSNGNLSHIALYLCLPVSIIAISVIISMCIRNLCRPLHKVLTGNRSN